MVEYKFIANCQPIEEPPIVISFNELHEELYGKGWTVHWEFNEAIDFYKYNDCVSYLDCREIEPDVANDVDKSGAWNYRLDNLRTGGVYDEEAEFFQGLFLIDQNDPNTLLVTFNVDLPNLTDGSSMFGMCKNLTSFSSALPNLTNGTSMFNNCTNLASWTIDLPNLTNGYGMFYYCQTLTSFSGDLSKLTTAQSMFQYCKNLTEWNTPLPNLTDGSKMFQSCRNLTSFSGDLSKLTNGYNMFMYCEKLVSWDTPLPNLTSGFQMFKFCNNFTSFEGDLSKMTDGHYMFYDTSLTSFNSDLSSLINGDYMFGISERWCAKLDLPSVQNIANTINDLKSVGKTGKIYIGMQTAIQGNAHLETALAAIRAKGWTVSEIYRS